MSSYLLVAFDGRGTLLQIQPPKNSVLAILAFDAQQGLLHPAFLGQCFPFSLLLRTEGIIVGKEVQLYRNRPCPQGLFLGVRAARKVDAIREDLGSVGGILSAPAGGD